MFSGYMPELNAYGLPVNSEDYLKGYAEGYEACKVDFMKFIKNLKVVIDKMEKTMKIEIHGYNFDVEEGDLFELIHISCTECGGAVGEIIQKRGDKVIQTEGAVYCGCW